MVHPRKDRPPHVDELGLLPPEQVANMFSLWLVSMTRMGHLLFWDVADEVAA